MKIIANKIIKIIRENFPNGIRSDFIDTRKVLRIYSEDDQQLHEKISCRAIADIIRENGIETGGRFYFISPEDAKEITQFFAELLQKNSILYYSAVYEMHSDFFIERNIFSSEILRKIIQASNFRFCSTDFCSTSLTTSLDLEIEKVFSIAENSLSLGDLQKKFPYVPSKKILTVLSNTKKYLKTVSNTYGSVAKIRFDFEEIHAAKNQILSQIKSKGYATSEDYSLVSNLALNSSFAENDLRNLIYEKFFSIDFIRQGRRLLSKCHINKNTEKSLLQNLREFIAAQNELSLEKLFAFARKLGIADPLALNTAYESMVRVAKDLFVKDSLIHFNVPAIDDALTSFVQKKIISLRSVTSFTGFPSIDGYSWNLFLLESFLKKYSKKYLYDAPTLNSTNVGAIYPKSMKFKGYLDVQSFVIIQERVPLEISAVENFLSEQGYRARRTGRATERVIARARTMLSPSVNA